jgi:hypothetical protein
MSTLMKQTDCNGDFSVVDLWNDAGLAEPTMIQGELRLG